MIQITAFIALLFLAGCASTLSNCIEKRGSLDIGSGTTKALAAEVDTCQKKIVRVLYEQQVPIAFGDALAKSDKKEIPQEFVEQSASKIQDLVTAMRTHNLKQISGLATSAFRNAQNGEDAAKELSRRIDVPVNVVTQEEEAEIGALSARSQKEFPQDTPFIVWDIGGGSMQMWTRTPEGTQLFKGQLASVSFKNQVIEKLQRKNPKKVASPNPIGKSATPAVTMAAQHAQENVPQAFKALPQNTKWIGIGGVLAISAQKQINKEARMFSRTELAETLARRAKLKDSEIDSKYRETEISNLALVLGYMQALNIDGVETVEVSLAQGWLLR